MHAADQRPALRALHIHHGLHPNADRWAEHCTKLGKTLGVPVELRPVQVDSRRGGSIEAAAREARYDALRRALDPGEVLLTAHHQDDQLETVLLQLLRGAGVAGLAAMPEVAPFAGGRLARPLLAWSRAGLEAWAAARKLAWVDDDTNLQERFDRNYLRRTVLPLVRARWPGAAAAVSRSARHAAEAQRLLDALALADVERAAVGAALSAHRLRALEPARRRNALRFWMTRAGYTVPDTRRLDEIAGPMLEARPDGRPRVQWSSSFVELHLDRLVLGTVQTAKGTGGDPSHEVRWSWRDQPRIVLEHLPGILEMEPDRHGPVDTSKLPAELIIRSRQGGEVLRLHDRGRTRTLKSLLQEARVPRPMRVTLPLVFAGDELIAVANYWVAASVRAGPACNTRVRLRFSAASPGERDAGRE